MNKYNTLKEMSERRLSICNDCPRFFKTTKTCLECGCFMKVKTLMSSSSCPIGRWGKEEGGA
jgi:hypothetical protein